MEVVGIKNLPSQHSEVTFNNKFKEKKCHDMLVNSLAFSIKLKSNKFKKP
jgi:hypothetical protein